MWPKLHRSSTRIPPPGGTKAHSIWTPQLLAWAGQPTWRLPGASSARGRSRLPSAYLPAPSGLLLVKSKIINLWGAEFQTNNVQRVQKYYYDIPPLFGPLLSFYVCNSNNHVTMNRLLLAHFHLWILSLAVLCNVFEQLVSQFQFLSLSLLYNLELTSSRRVDSAILRWEVPIHFWWELNHRSSLQALEYGFGLGKLWITCWS